VPAPAPARRKLGAHRFPTGHLGRAADLWHGAGHRRDYGRRGLRKQLRRTCGDRVSPEHVSAASAQDQLDAAQASESFLLFWSRFVILSVRFPIWLNAEDRAVPCPDIEIEIVAPDGHIGGPKRLRDGDFGRLWDNEP